MRVIELARGGSDEGGRGEALWIALGWDEMHSKQSWCYMHPEQHAVLKVAKTNCLDRTDDLLKEKKLTL